MVKPGSEQLLSVGFAGLGRMGIPMARNLVAAGLDLSVWNRTSAIAEEFSALHETYLARTPAALAGQSEVVITMLADDAAAEDVYLGNRGLLFADQLPAAMCEMGTISPTLARNISDIAAQKGVTFVDAPVSGSVKAADDAVLLIMAGSDEQNAGALAEVFAFLGKKTIWLGKTGQGAAMKLAVNMLIHGLNQTLAEALITAEGAGIDLVTAFEVIENSAAAAPMIQYRKPLYLDETSQPVSFSTELAAKDVALALALWAGGDEVLPQAKLNLSLLREAIDQGFGQRDMAAMLDFMRKRRK